MRTLSLLFAIAACCVLLGVGVVPVPPGEAAEPDYPWRRTADGWEQATWLPKELPAGAEKTAVVDNPSPAPHPLLLVALQVMAIAFATVAEWPDSRRKSARDRA